MIKDLQSLRELIVYAKSQGVQGFKIGDVEVSFSPFAFTDLANTPEEAPKANEERNTSKTLVDTMEPSQEDEELLFWSSKS